MKESASLFYARVYAKQRGKGLSEREQQRRIEQFVSEAWEARRAAGNVEDGRCEGKENDMAEFNKAQLNKAEFNKAQFNRSAQFNRGTEFNKAEFSKASMKRPSTIHTLHNSKAPKLNQNLQAQPAKSLYQIHTSSGPQIRHTPPAPCPNSPHEPYPNNFHEPLRPFTRPFFLF